MIRKEIQEKLFTLQDVPYRDFQMGLIPGYDTDRMIGVRTPALRALAKEYAKREEIRVFLEDLPHDYFEENQLHSFLIGEMKDFDACMAETERFLPYVDNWATCDQLSPGVFRKHKDELLQHIKGWLCSGHTYIVRFGIGMLMQHFLDEDFRPEYPELVAQIHSDEYYVNMMIAWYFATALAKQYDASLPYLLEDRLAVWTHNKTIQKAIESRRFSPEQKDYLKTLRRK